MSLFTRSLKSHRSNRITVAAMKSSLKALGFNVADKDAIRHEIKKLDKEVVDLLGDNKAYWANRKACWDLTDLYIAYKGGK